MNTILEKRIGVYLWYEVLQVPRHHFSSRVLDVVTSLFFESATISTLIAVVAFSCFWSILELFEQRKRVRKGWFPAIPKHKSK